MSVIRWVFVAVVSVLAISIVGAVVFFFVIPEGDPTAIQDFPKAEQSKKSQLIIEGLNTHNISEVQVIRGNNVTDAKQKAALDAQDATVISALPGPGCRYSLRSVDDKGVQGKAIAPGLINAQRVYRLNLNVDELCPTRAASARTLGLLFIPYWAHWTPLAFAD